MDLSRGLGDVYKRQIKRFVYELVMLLRPVVI
jgi:hypothetical protein